MVRQLVREQIRLLFEFFQVTVFIPLGYATEAISNYNTLIIKILFKGKTTLI
jgi:hypothetical protein